MRTLLVNAIKTPDGTIIESNHRHDYVAHLDKNGEYYTIDGGLDYVRRSVNKEPAEDACVYSDDPHEKKRERFKWGTRGKDGDEALHWIPISTMSAEHIQNVLDTQTHIRTAVRKLFIDELTYRKTILNEPA